jgi:hypothetical protein
MNANNFGRLDIGMSLAKEDVSSLVTNWKMDNLKPSLTGCQGTHFSFMQIECGCHLPQRSGGQTMSDAESIHPPAVATKNPGNYFRAWSSVAARSLQ